MLITQGLRDALQPVSKKEGKYISTSKTPEQIVEIYLWGPTQQVSLGGNNYFFSMIDDYSRRVWVYILKSKDQVFDKFLEWKNLVEN